MRRQEYLHKQTHERFVVDRPAGHGKKMQLAVEQHLIENYDREDILQRGARQDQDRVAGGHKYGVQQWNHAVQHSPHRQDQGYNGGGGQHAAYHAAQEAPTSSPRWVAQRGPQDANRYRDQSEPKNYGGGRREYHYQEQSFPRDARGTKNRFVGEDGRLVGAMYKRPPSPTPNSPSDNGEDESDDEEKYYSLGVHYVAREGESLKGRRRMTDEPDQGRAKYVRVARDKLEHQSGWWPNGTHWAYDRQTHESCMHRVDY